jgi:predicted membrane channel-forming protein YqfA (hemolysin III family)
LWLLLIFVTVVWLIVALVDGLIQNCGVVLVPVVVAGVFVWAVAMVIDVFASPWGTNIVVGLHLALLAWTAVGFAMFVWRSRR